MSFSFRPAVRQNVSLLIGLAGASGAGKTYSALRLASGMAGKKPFVVIDTEAGRACHYADQFRFDHGDLRPPFTPAAYADAIAAADAAGYPVIVVDSCSHEHAGEGGLLEMQEAEFARMGSREAVKMTSWIKPKGEHRKMVSRLLQIRAHLILCFRAEEKVEMVRQEGGKMEVRKKQTAIGIDGWVPICEKTLPYELTASFLLLAARPGVPVPIKLQEQHKPLVPLDQPLTETAGRRLSAWAQGSAPAPPEDPAGLLGEIQALLVGAYTDTTPEAKRIKSELVRRAFKRPWCQVTKLGADELRAGLATIRQMIAGLHGPVPELVAALPPPTDAGGTPIPAFQGGALAPEAPITPAEIDAALAAGKESVEREIAGGTVSTNLVNAGLVDRPTLDAVRAKAADARLTEIRALMDQVRWEPEKQERFLAEYRGREEKLLKHLQSQAARLIGKGGASR